MTSDLNTTKSVLTSLGTEFRIAEVLAVQMENGTGSLARVLEKLADEHINVEYAYASTTAAPGKALGIFHTSNPKRACQILNEASRSRAPGAPGVVARCTLARAKTVAASARRRRRGRCRLGVKVTVKKKKVRVALRKNRQNRTRANDLTRKFRDDELTPAAEPGVDRVRPRGELSRHRTIIEEVAEQHDRDARNDSPDASGRRAIDTSTCLRGRVVRVHGLFSVVLADDGRTYPCHVRRLLKTLAIEGRSVVTVGDQVWFRPGSAAGSDGLIERVEGRRGVITRGYRHRQHIIAANVDQVLIVSALAEPGLKLGLIDRYLISAEIGGVRPVIVFNKADLVELATYQWVIGLYAQLGYETVVTSVADGRGSATACANFLPRASRPSRARAGSARARS